MTRPINLPQRINIRAAEESRSAKPKRLSEPLLVLAIEEIAMDKDRIVGAAHQVKGAVKQTVGRVTGDAKTQAEGAAEKASGKAQSIVGGAKDAVWETVKK
jgi:uncharacterized protein YjbJ (UPF0337 family)